MLIVEYNTWLRLVLARLFDDLGYSVATASNGCAGLRLARALQPRMVILGDGLPELSTETLADELHKLQQPNSIQVILVSELLASPTEAATATASEAGATECCSPQHLLPRLHLQLAPLGAN